MLRLGYTRKGWESMKTYAEMSKEELLKEKESLEQQFKEVESK